MLSAVKIKLAGCGGSDDDDDKDDDSINNNNLIYFNFEPNFKLWWCRAQNFNRSQIPVTTGRFELRTSYTQRICLTHLAIGPWPNWLSNWTVD